MDDLKKAVNTSGGLIDAKELMEWLKNKIRECVILNAHAEAATTEEIIWYVKAMTAIEAIPIEWLKRKYEENDPDSGNEDFDRYLWDSICYVLTAWKEEQEEEE